MLTLSTLGFFEHSQSGGRGGAADSAPLPHRNFFIINANEINFAQLLTDVSSTISWCNFFEICYDVIVTS